MNFQENLFAKTADLRTRGAALATAAVAAARTRAHIAVNRIEGLKGALGVLSGAGRELNQVARRHVVRFVRESSTIAADARKDVSSLARSTYSTLAAKRGTAKPKARKSPVARKRAKAKAA